MCVMCMEEERRDKLEAVLETVYMTQDDGIINFSF